ncbi:hypothetical protein CY35_03G017900 [Sphagnum magellanicum]|nr:hypothetical protein CY35_03G017900 [Sphagnum magellanicum]
MLRCCCCVGEIVLHLSACFAPLPRFSGDQLLCFLSWMNLKAFINGNWTSMATVVFIFNGVVESAMAVVFSSGGHGTCLLCFLVQLVEEQAIDYNDLVPPSPIEGDKTVPSPSADLLKDSNSRNPGSTHVDLPPKGPEGRGDPNDPCVRLKRDCVALLAAFRLIDVPTRIFILGNTQLYWDPEWPDVKLAQACYLLSWLVKFKESIQSKSDSPPLLVITGDYNSLPGDQVYNYLTSGLEENDTSQQHTRERRRDDFEDKLLNVLPSPVQFQDSSVKHDPRMTLLRAPLPLVSLYGHVQGVHPDTNVTPGFTGPIDYIFFYPSDCLQPRSLLALPLPGAPDIQGGLPNHTHPSDHLPIGADLAVF